MYTKKHDFFSVPNPINCYWAGFIAADGYIKDIKDGVVSIKLCDGDSQHLSLFTEYCGYNGPIKRYTDNTKFSGLIYSSSVTICGVHQWITDLHNIFNITPAKSLTLKPPHLTQREHILSFIKGYIDGDGCITTYSVQRRQKTYKVLELTILGTHNMLSWIKTQIGGTSKAQVRKKSKSNIFVYKATYHTARTALTNMREVCQVELGRKWSKFDDYMSTTV